MPVAGTKMGNAHSTKATGQHKDVGDESDADRGRPVTSARGKGANPRRKKKAVMAPKAGQRSRKPQHRPFSPLAEDVSSRADMDDDEVGMPVPTAKRPNAHSTKATGQHKDIVDESDADRRRPVASARGKGANPRRKARSRPPTPTNANAQAEASGLDEIQDLQRQLQEEKGHPSYHI